MYKTTIYLLILSLFLFIACNRKTSPEQSTIRVAVLRGPTAIVFASWMNEAPIIEGRKVEITIVDSPEQMQAILISGKAEIAALPMITAANLYNKGVKYRVAGCPVWGNLYLVESSRTLPGDSSLYLFGAGTTPDILTRYFCREKGISYQYNYTYPTVREIVQGIYAGKINRAVLAEPYLSMVLQKDTTFTILADLNSPTGKKTGFPQTAILYHPSIKVPEDSINYQLTIAALHATQHPEETIRILEEKEIFPSGILTSESIQRCNIHYLTTREIEREIRLFLELIYQYEPRAIGGHIPENSFFKENK